MKRLRLAGALALLAALPLAGQADEVADDIVQLSEDTYVIRRDEQPIYRAGSFTRQKRRIVDDAEAFAAQRGKAVEEVSFDEEEHLLNEYYGPHSWEYRFRLVDPPGQAAATGQAAGAAPAAAAPAPTATPAAVAAPLAAAAAAAPPPAGGQAAAAPPAAEAAATPATERGKPDVDEIYEELTKLDELRKKGLLSNEEFETLKQRVLAAH